MSEESYNVVQFFDNDTYEYVRRNVPAKEAVEAAAHYTRNVAARRGLVRKVIITDEDDHTNFLWEYGRGIVYPTQEMVEDATSKRREP